jgi:3-isopropylmalate/(R)-2-methylmalate dehydratase small subunit
VPVSEDEFMTDSKKPSDTAILEVAARGIPLEGGSIDTDRIMPARYLRCVTFEGLERHVFEDDRASAGDPPHPFDQKRFQGAGVLVAGRNFGCGSSREHAPQGLLRWGIKAIVAESFAEIFFGNCVALGVPCVTLEAQAIRELQSLIEADPSVTVRVRLDDLKVLVGDSSGREEKSFTPSMPEGARESFVKGTWDATATLLAAPEEIDSVADSLPYFKAFV